MLRNCATSESLGGPCQRCLVPWAMSFNICTQRGSVGAFQCPIATPDSALMMQAGLARCHCWVRSSLQPPLLLEEMPFSETLSQPFALLHAAHSQMHDTQVKRAQELPEGLRPTVQAYNNGVSTELRLWRVHTRTAGWALGRGSLLQAHIGMKTGRSMPRTFAPHRCKGPTNSHCLKQVRLHNIHELLEELI